MLCWDDDCIWWYHLLRWGSSCPGGEQREEARSKSDWVREYLEKVADKDMEDSVEEISKWEWLNITIFPANQEHTNEELFKDWGFQLFFKHFHVQPKFFEWECSCFE